MILLQAMMLAPFALVFGYIIIALAFLGLIVAYNFIIRKIKKEEARFINPLWSLVLSFILTVVIVFWWASLDAVSIN